MDEGSAGGSGGEEGAAEAGMGHLSGRPEQDGSCLPVIGRPGVVGERIAGSTLDADHLLQLVDDVHEVVCAAMTASIGL